MKKSILLLALLIGFGLARLPWEDNLATRLRGANLQTLGLDPDMRDRLGQLGFMAAFGGFRSLIASTLYVQSITTWYHVQWGKLKFTYDTITTLQPRFIQYWEIGSWHMAYNAAAAQLTNPPNATLSELVAQQKYYDLGRDILLRGIRNNPDRYELYARLGRLLADKYEDHCGAAEYYLQAIEKPGAPQHFERFAAYALAQCPGKEREALARLRELYERGERQRTPTLLKYLQQLESK